MKRTSRFLTALTFMMLLAMLLVILPSAQATGDAPPANVIPTADLQIQLGPKWVGVEFHLKTDYGMYPEPIYVGQDGVIRMVIGGSSKYLLSCFDSDYIPDPDEEQPESTTATTEPAPTTEPVPTAESTTAPTVTPQTETVKTEVPEAEAGKGSKMPLVAIFIIMIAAILGLMVSYLSLSAKYRNLQRELQRTSFQTDSNYGRRF